MLRPHSVAADEEKSRRVGRGRQPDIIRVAVWWGRVCAAPKNHVAVRDNRRLDGYGGVQV